MPYQRDEVTVTIHTPTAALDGASCWCVIHRGSSTDVSPTQESIDVVVFEGEPIAAKRKAIPQSDGRLASREAAGNL
jgi:hypothetical protein